jgi:hypothetical protein
MQDAVDPSDLSAFAVASFGQLAQELARLDGLIHAHWMRQQAAHEAQGESQGLAVPRLFPAEAEAALHALVAHPPAPVNNGPHMAHLLQLARYFQLDEFATDALLVILAPALDSRFGRIYGYLQDDLTLRAATVDLVLTLLCPPGVERLRFLHQFSEQGPLVQHKLVVVEEGNGPLLSRTLQPDPTLVAWLLGDYRPAPQWVNCFTLTLPEADASDNALTDDLWPDVVAGLHGQNLLCFYGEDSASQAAAVRRLAVEAQMPLLTVEMRELVAAGVKPTAAVRLALRDACFTGAVLHLVDFDALLEEGVLPGALLQPLLHFGGTIVTTGKARWQPKGMWRKEAILWQHFHAPSYAGRRRLWHFFLAQAQPDHGLDVEALAGRFRLYGWQMRDVIASARDHALRVGRNGIGEEELHGAIRAYSQTRLGELANRIVPRYTWRDLVLPAPQLEVLHAVVSMVKQRALVLEDWGIGRKLLPNSAVSVLFAGDPGTGKTMAAEVLAAQLGLDLYKIDLASMVSKYIGETEKNLEAVFHEAERSNAILFFDEADAVFGKRSGIRDAHDRYANIGVSYLLQRMESHEGVTILATNLRANLDEAFTRRLQFVVDFPFPEVAERLRIWQALLPPTLPLAADVQLEQLAHRFKLAGGNIRNIIISAAFMAAEAGQVVTMEMLLEGVRREFQKMGRLAESDSRPSPPAAIAPLALPPSAPVPPPNRMVKPLPRPSTPSGPTRR